MSETAATRQSHALRRCRASPEPCAARRLRLDLAVFPRSGRSSFPRLEGGCWDSRPPTADCVTRCSDVSPFPCSRELSPLEKTLMPHQPGEGASAEQVRGCRAVTQCVLGVESCVTRLLRKHTTWC